MGKFLVATVEVFRRTLSKTRCHSFSDRSWFPTPRFAEMSTAATKEDKKTIRFLFLGDVMLGRLVDKLFPSHCKDEEEQSLAFALLQVSSFSPALIHVVATVLSSFHCNAQVVTHCSTEIHRSCKN